MMAKSKSANWLFYLLLTCILISNIANAANIPEQTDWATGTNWEYKENHMGFPNVWIYTPDSFSKRVADKRAAIFYIKGCGQRGFQVAQAGGWPDAAEEYGMVVIIPEVIDPASPNNDAPNVECYNYGYDGMYGVFTPTKNTPDHKAIINAARKLTTDSEFADLKIDSNQVYITGLSAGGTVSMQVSCMAPELFAGVATSSSPNMGTSQGTAVMPPDYSFSKETVKDKCKDYMNSSDVSNAEEELKKHIYISISDDNGLPAGAGPMDTSKFYNQEVWDGDKFCPHIYQHTREDALVDLLGLGSSNMENSIAIGTGTGIGCSGGEVSEGDAGEVTCMVKNAVDRDWTAYADIYKNSDGNVQLIRIEQDTLRHAWPAGEKGPNDLTCQPDRDTLRAEGYYDSSTGAFNIDNSNRALNGQLGVIYFNHGALDFPMYMAKVFTNNNIRLGAPLTGNMGPSIQNLLAVPAGDSSNYTLKVTGTVVDTESDAIESVNLTLTNITSGTSLEPINLFGSGSNTVEIDSEFAGITEGIYKLTVKAIDELGNESISTKDNISFGEITGTPPTASIVSASASGADCITIAVSAEDADGSIANVKITVLGIGSFDASESDGNWSHQECGLLTGTYSTFAIATDDTGMNSAPSDISNIDLAGGGDMQTASGDLTAHCDEGRVTRFTVEYNTLRDSHCTQESFTWTCDSFDMYRCSDDEEWTDEMPTNCGGSTEINLVELDAVIAATESSALQNETVVFETTITNSGPDSASAVYLINELPSALIFESASEGCSNDGRNVICHLNLLEANEEIKVTINVKAVLSGTIQNSVRVGSAQTEDEIVAQTFVNVAENASNSINNQNGTQNGPAVQISSPENGATVNGTVRIIVNAEDTDGIMKIELYLDDELLGLINTAPYEYNWDTTSHSEGYHKLYAIAYDMNQNPTTSSYVHLTIDKTLDSDNDGLTDDEDNCPFVANQNQADSDNNGVGDVCENSSNGTSNTNETSNSNGTTNSNGNNNNEQNGTECAECEVQGCGCSTLSSVNKNKPYTGLFLTLLSAIAFILIRRKQIITPNIK